MINNTHDAPGRQLPAPAKLQREGTQFSRTRFLLVRVLQFKSLNWGKAPEPKRRSKEVHILKRTSVNQFRATIVYRRFTDD